MTESKQREKAVALKYDIKKGDAPVVVASGAGKVAENIIASAKEAGVFIKEDPDLVEILAKVPIGDQIPGELYHTVAEILAFVYSVNSRYKKNKE